MEVETFRPVAEIVRITRNSDARELALATYARLIGLLETLEPEEWRAPTECDGWDVSAMVGHLVGAARAGASLRTTIRQQAWGRRHAAEFGHNSLDAANERQIRDHAALSPPERIAALRRFAPAAVRARMRFPRPLRRIRVPLDPGGSTPPGTPTHLALGHLMDVVYTRDAWLHTIDISRATGRGYDPDPAVDGRIIEDIVAEWAARHGRPFAMELPGPHVARFRQGAGGGTLTLDGIALGRILSGRAQLDDGSVTVEAEPATTVELLQTRVVF